jgi:hypothetical protein
MLIGVEGVRSADVSSWYFTKLYSGFAWVVLIAGGLMGLSFAIMWITSMYQMWFYTPPEFVSKTDTMGIGSHD